MQATFNNHILIFFLCNFISVNISVFLISSLLKRDLTSSLSEGNLWNSCIERKGETERVGEKKALVKDFLSVLQGNVCVHMHVPAQAHRQADPDITIKRK